MAEYRVVCPGVSSGKHEFEDETGGWGEGTCLHCGARDPSRPVRPLIDKRAQGGRMAEEHTPGPWRRDAPVRLSPSEADGHWHPISGRGWEWFALVAADVRPAVAEANARLVTAAPDLYELLILALPYVETATAAAPRRCRWRPRRPSR